MIGINSKYFGEGLSFFSLIRPLSILCHSLARFLFSKQYVFNYSHHTLVFDILFHALSTVTASTFHRHLDFVAYHSHPLDEAFGLTKWRWKRQHDPTRRKKDIRTEISLPEPLE